MSIPNFPGSYRLGRGFIGAAVIVIVLVAGGIAQAQDEGQAMDDITGKYHFLSADDTLAILDEEGRLKGYIEVAQPDSESQDVLNYDILEGSCKKNHVQFHTNRIHGTYYRFAGTVGRGKGHEEKDPDYLHLEGDLDIVTVTVTVDSQTAKETEKENVRTVRVFLKSFGKSERPDE